MKRFLLIIFVLVFKTSFGQITDTVHAPATVIVHKDPRVDLLINKQSSINIASKKAAARTMRGYRLLVISTNKRDEAMAAKTKIYTYYPELQSYLTYQSPFFKLKVGNFKTRDEADTYRKMLNSLFPKEVFIMNDTIEVKGEKEEESD